MKFNPKNDLGDYVFVINDREQIPRVITAIEFDGAGSTIYTLSKVDSFITCSEHEFSDVPTIIEIKPIEDATE